MNDDDIHGLSGAYAVDAVDDVERARFEAHLPNCAACQSEVASLRAAAGELSLLTLAAPPASLRASVLRNITSVRPAPPLIDRAESPVMSPAGSPVSLDSKRTERAERSRRHPGRWLAGAAAAVVMVTGGTLWHPWSSGQEQGTVQLTASQQVLQAPDAQRFVTKVGKATATVVRSTSLNKAVIVTAKMPNAPEGKVYELWLQQGPTMVKAGFMPKGPSNTVLLQGDAATAAGAGITIEPSGGSATPSLPPVALIAFT
jgi:anti-sigma factor RsiW